MGIRALILISFLAANPHVGAARANTIMPLGDSITEGGANFANYRAPLHERLLAGGYAVRYVGSRTSDGPAGAMRHEGYSGKTAEFLADNIERLYKANPADVVLLHAGHNYFSEHKPVDRIIAATERIVRGIHSIRGDATVFVAQVIPSGKLPKYAYIPELNAALPKLVERLKAEKIRVSLVDQADGFDWRTDTVADKVHPNDRGAEKMARQWYKALVEVIPTSRGRSAAEPRIERRGEPHDSADRIRGSAALRTRLVERGEYR